MSTPGDFCPHGRPAGAPCAECMPVTVPLGSMDFSSMPQKLVLVGNFSIDIAHIELGTQMRLCNVPDCPTCAEIARLHAEVEGLTRERDAARILCEARTDQRDRLAAALRGIFEKRTDEQGFEVGARCVCGCDPAMERARAALAEVGP